MQILEHLKQEHELLKAQLAKKARYIHVLLSLLGDQKRAGRLLQDQVYATFEEHIRPLSLEVAQSIKAWRARGVDDAQLVYYIKKARQFHLPNWAYVNALLKRYTVTVPTEPGGNMTL